MTDLLSYLDNLLFTKCLTGIVLVSSSIKEKTASINSFVVRNVGV